MNEILSSVGSGDEEGRPKNVRHYSRYRWVSYVLVAALAATGGAGLARLSPSETLDGGPSALTEEERNDTFLSAVYSLACSGIQQSSGIGTSQGEGGLSACRSFELMSRRVPRRSFRDSIGSESQLAFLDSTRGTERLWGLAVNSGRATSTFYEVALACRVADVGALNDLAKPRWPWQSPTVSWSFISRVAEYRRIQCDALGAVNSRFSPIIRTAKAANLRKLDSASEDWEFAEINSGQVSFPEPHSHVSREPRDELLTETDEKRLRGSALTDLYCPSLYFWGGGKLPEHGFCKWQLSFNPPSNPDVRPASFDMDPSCRDYLDLEGELGELLFYLSRCEVVGFDGNAPAIQSRLTEWTYGQLPRKQMPLYIAQNSVACRVAVEAWRNLFVANPDIVSLRDSWLTDRAAVLASLQKSPDDLHYGTIVELFGGKEAE
jgi:hypothetical protein